MSDLQLSFLSHTLLSISSPLPITLYHTECHLLLRTLPIVHSPARQPLISSSKISQCIFVFLHHPSFPSFDPVPTPQPRPRIPLRSTMLSGSPMPLSNLLCGHRRVHTCIPQHRHHHHLYQHPLLLFTTQYATQTQSHFSPPSCWCPICVAPLILSPLL
jgi:hypothetical protein